MLSEQVCNSFFNCHVGSGGYSNFSGSGGSRYPGDPGGYSSCCCGSSASCRLQLPRWPRRQLQLLLWIKRLLSVPATSVAPAATPVVAVDQAPHVALPAPASSTAQVATPVAASDQAAPATAPLKKD